MAGTAEINPMAKWAISIGEANLGPRAAALFAEINRPRHETAIEFQIMGLPGYNNQVQVPFREFEADPNEVMSRIQTELCWFQVLPIDGDQNAKLTEVGDGLEKEYAKQRILGHVAAKSAEDRTEIFISEFLKNYYGGNITVNKAGELYAEFGEGVQIQYSAGEVSPTHFVTKKTGEVVRYSFEDTLLRSAIWKTIRSIPHADGEFYPGYYEFALAGESLRPIFFDYRHSTIYQLGNRPIPLQL